MHYVGRACGTHVHMTGLLRLAQGPFNLSHCLHEDEWTAARIEACIVECNQVVKLETTADETGTRAGNESEACVASSDCLRINNEDR